MPELLRERTVTARKSHSCRTCGAKAIQAGETYVRATYVYDSRVYDWVQCVECARLQHAVYDWAGRPEDGIGAGDYQEFAEEQLSTPGSEHLEASRAYLRRARRGTAPI
jgi:hypothetical protein